MDDFKWPGIMFLGMFIVGLAGSMYDSWADLSIAKTAMENGYIQTIDKESGKTLWVKDDANQP